MKPNTQVILGGVAFERFETPERLPFGGDQRTQVHDLAGGGRVVDTLGATPTDPTWSGIFLGKNALARALAIDALRKAGLPLKLTWSELSYTVVIQSFRPDYTFSTHIPYTITCIASADNTAIKPQAETSVDGMMSGDASLAVQQAARFGNASLTNAVAAVSNAISGVRSFIELGQEGLARVLAPVEAARSIAGSLIAELEGDSGIDLLAIAGPYALSDVAERVRVGAVNLGGIADLYVLDATLSRMSANLGSVGTSGALVVQAGGSLYRLAADAYGDATAWVDIAAANGLVDPEIEGIAELRVPPKQNSSGGVLIP